MEEGNTERRNRELVRSENTGKAWALETFTLSFIFCTCSLEVSLTLGKAFHIPEPQFSHL